MLDYVINYEVCSLLFLIVITVRFFCIRKYPSKLNTLFGTILFCAIADIMLDIAGTFSITYAEKLPLAVNYLINTAFYMFQVALPFLMLIYVISMCGCDKQKLNCVFHIPALLCMIALLVNPFNGIIFSFEEVGADIVFTHGFLFGALYSVSVIYLLLAAAFVVRYRKRLEKHEIFTVTAFIGIVLSAIVIQIFLPKILLTGAAVSVSILMMFFIIQNPEAMLDVVSGVFNYSALHEYLRTKTSEGKKLWLTAVDIGGIRRINSLYGHRFGNEMLRQTGNFLNGICTGKAMVFQVVGTKYLVVSHSAEAHSMIINEITERFRGWWKNGDIELQLIATVRYSENGSRFSSPEDVINLIDLAYSKSLESDFGITKPIGAALLEQSKRKTLIEDALKRAINTGSGFTLNYQPIYSAAKKRFCSAEALLRLNDPELGQISPAEFIPVAEKSGLIIKIDSIVLDMASEFLKKHDELADCGFECLEINLSAAEFYHSTDEFEKSILQKLRGVEKSVCFEVTETAATIHREILSGFMNRMIKKGVTFAIDDFGTGYANILQLARLPFSIAKLDRAFIASDKKKDKLILEDIVKMFRRTELITVVEGVETEKQKDFAFGIGADEIQGFYYSTPLPEEDFVSFICGAKCPACTANKQNRNAASNCKLQTAD